MNSVIKIFLISVVSIANYNCDINNPEEEKELEGEFTNHPYFVLTSTSNIVTLINDSTYTIDVDEDGNAKIELEVKFKYSLPGKYIYWDCASETGYTSLKSKKIYSSHQNTLTVSQIDLGSTIMVAAGIRNDNNALFIAYKYFTAI